MTRNELIASVADATGQPADVVKSFLDTLTDTVIEAVRSGEQVKLPNFGTFAPQFRPSRPGRNPTTGETVTIAERRTMKFKVSVAVTDHLTRR